MRSHPESSEAGVWEEPWLPVVFALPDGEVLVLPVLLVLPALLVLCWVVVLEVPVVGAEEEPSVGVVADLVELGEWLELLAEFVGLW